MLQRYIPRDWLLPSEEEKPWIDALKAAGRRRNGPLIGLLKSSPMPGSVSWHLADLFDRYNLTKRRGKNKQVPSYELSENMNRLLRAGESYRRYRAEGKSREEALELAARNYGVHPEVLRLLIEGKHAGARRVQKRRPPLNRRP
jgi:hypothetical protein